MEQNAIIRNYFPAIPVNDVPAIIEAKVDADGNGIEKEVSKSYQCVHVSFQSTSSWNFSTLNALNKCKTTAMIRSRGRGGSKRYWGIEMNEA
eukprot:15364525-Ditylum_brightwellii.AAC.2